MLVILKSCSHMTACAGKEKGIGLWSKQREPKGTGGILGFLEQVDDQSMVQSTNLLRCDLFFHNRDQVDGGRP